MRWPLPVRSTSAPPSVSSISAAETWPPATAAISGEAPLTSCQLTAAPARKNREKETAQQIAQRKEHWAVAKYLKIEGLNWLKEHDKDL